MNRYLTLPTVIQYFFLGCLLIAGVFFTWDIQFQPQQRLVCPATVNKGISGHGQRIMVEGKSCVISTTIDEFNLRSTPSLASTSHHPRTPPYTIVTAVSYKSMCALENFLYTLYEYRAHLPNFPRVVVYNLGVNETNQLDILNQLHDNGLMDELLPFDYQQYPDIWDISAKHGGEHGWKTAMVYEQSQRKDGNGLLVWINSSSKVTLKFLHRLPSYISDGDGFWAPRGRHRHRNQSPSINTFSNSRTLCNGAVFGLDARNPSIFNSIIEPWYQCSREPNNIQKPPGTFLHCETQDLTTLAYKSGYTCEQSPRFFKIHTHRAMACRATLLERDTQGLLYHPSVVDRMPWSSSDTKDLNDHPHWRFPPPKSIRKHFFQLQVQDTNELDE